MLNRAQLSTRAFYRHFDSKDQLVAALFLEMARVEMRRLRQLMAAAVRPGRAVAAWIDGRLDLAFDSGSVAISARCRWRRSRRCSPPRNWSAPPTRDPAAARRATRTRKGSRSIPRHRSREEALSIQGVVWANIERQWATPVTATRPRSARRVHTLLSARARRRAGDDRRSPADTLAEC